MTKPAIFRIRLDDPGAEAIFRRFTAAICGESGHGRHAVLVFGAEEPRLILQNSGRCLDADTPWRMTREVLAPVFLFDDQVEWVALFPMEDWQMRCDAALGASFTDTRSWSRLLAEELAAELPIVTHLIVSR
ncbi:hypothetical protein CCC_00105 [Paramagnetospirillum magnetotacticum MS-1]|uniref:Uncharacterized protein n=1 Tax=Paramagnetospirillum magnetotacticum MS-1 TaxID=272627 RepID=A0A0C2YBC4_PARME|nr:hypothetical protein [Paramagnetospirillum magnetotacticum]KIL97044.1 hypothetical protein CCC_00105 [Paramagnetospirillum magnetotacticum MS-1]